SDTQGSEPGDGGQYFWRDGCFPLRLCLIFHKGLRSNLGGSIISGYWNGVGRSRKNYGARLCIWRGGEPSARDLIRRIKAGCWGNQKLGYFLWGNLRDHDDAQS